MKGPSEIDSRNTYVPNLSDIQESAERTYGEACCFYEAEELYLEHIERKIARGELSDPKKIYDVAHAIASDLAKCCEMFLKAIFIYEHNVPGTSIDELWELLKNEDYAVDSKGNRKYLTASGVVTFPKYDSDGELCRYSNGDIIYIDEAGNTYNNGNRGQKIKRNGHQLDRLIEYLSPRIRAILELRMESIESKQTEKRSSVSLIDYLMEEGLIDNAHFLTPDEFNGWVDKHKRTFEESRYAGQKNCDVNVEFLFHLATQLKALAQYLIEPNKEQDFSVYKGDIEKLPEELRQLASFHQFFITPELIKLLASNVEVKSKLAELLSDDYCLPSAMVSPSNFCKMLQAMDKNEITYVSLLCLMIDKIKLFSPRPKIDEKYEKMYNLAELCAYRGLDSNSTVEFLLEFKSIYGDDVKIGDENIDLITEPIRSIPENTNSEYEVFFVNNKIINEYDSNYSKIKIR